VDEANLLPVRKGVLVIFVWKSCSLIDVDCTVIQWLLYTALRCFAFCSLSTTALVRVLLQWFLMMQRCYLSFGAIKT